MTRPGSTDRSCRCRRRIGATLAAVTLLGVTVTGAQPQTGDPERLVALAATLQRIAAASQARIAGLDDETRALRAERAGIDDRVEAYRGQIELLEAELATVQADIDDANADAVAAESTAAEILPMMASMIDRLGQFVDLDLPFDPDARRRAATQLRATMIRADLGLAEKFRRIADAWRTEVGYGYTVAAWQGALPGEDRIVELLRLGRTALYYRTPDRREAGVWVAGQGRWLPLDAGQRAALDVAFAVARDERLPELLTLPVPLPPR